MKEAIAAKFQVDENSFVLNLPPRPGCLPGSIFTGRSRVPLVRTAQDDPKLVRGPVFQFSAALDFDAGASASANVGWWGAAASASATADAAIEFKDARVVEILGPELKRRVMADPERGRRRSPASAALRRSSRL